MFFEDVDIVYDEKDKKEWPVSKKKFDADCLQIDNFNA